jgi:DNA-binding transcriptional MerR regulator
MSNNNAKAAGSETAAADSTDSSLVPESHILTLGVVARMFKISALALRFYELRALIRRERLGDAWVYSWSDCERIAMLVKARKVGVAVREFAAVLSAIDERASNPVANSGRQQCLSLIRALESRKKFINDLLDELYRVDWELSDRLGVEGTLDKGVSFESV